MPGSFDELFGRHIREFFDGSNAGGFKFLNSFRTNARQFRQRSARRSERGHLRFDLAPLLFLALDVNIPADQLARETYVLSLFADCERKLGVLDDNLEALLFGIDDLYARNFRRAEGLFARRRLSLRCTE